MPVSSSILSQTYGTCLLYLICFINSQIIFTLVSNLLLLLSSVRSSKAAILFRTDTGKSTWSGEMENEYVFWALILRLFYWKLKFHIEKCCPLTPMIQYECLWPPKLCKMWVTLDIICDSYLLLLFFSSFSWVTNSILICSCVWALLSLVATAGCFTGGSRSLFSVGSWYFCFKYSTGSSTPLISLSFSVIRI